MLVLKYYLSVANPAECGYSISKAERTCARYPGSDVRSSSCYQMLDPVVSPETPGESSVMMFLLHSDTSLFEFISAEETHGHLMELNLSSSNHKHCLACPSTASVFSMCVSLMQLFFDIRHKTYKECSFYSREPTDSVNLTLTLFKQVTLNGFKACSHQMIPSRQRQQCRLGTFDLSDGTVMIRLGCIPILPINTVFLRYRSRSVCLQL